MTKAAATISASIVVMMIVIAAPGVVAQSNPYRVAIDSMGSIYAADVAPHNVRKYVKQ